MLRIANWLWSRLFLRLQIFIGTLAALCVALGLLLWSAEQQEKHLDGLSEATFRKQAIVEKVNGLVYAVVMESRGLYMAADPQAIERFGKGLETHLKSLQATVDEWKPLVDESDRAAFETFQASNAQFIKLRTELVAEARAKGSAGARAVGDNETNRSVRTAFNKSLEALALNYKQRLVELEAANEAKHFWAELYQRSALGLVLLMLVIGGYWLHRYMKAPFEHIAKSLARLNAGETDFEIHYQKRADEVGTVARAIHAFQQSVIAERRSSADQLKEANARLKRQQELEAAINAFEANASGRVGQVAATSGELHGAAATMSAAAEETARQAEIVTEAAHELATNIDTLSAAGSNLAHAITEISEGMSRASAISDAASRTSASTAEKFEELKQAVATIGDIVQLINSIASQTNLLALNATIEAARAGEAGRGFAVVAAEVKQLASQTTKATGEIADSIAHVQQVANQSVDAVAAIGRTIEDVRRIAAEVAEAVEQQRLAAQDIAANVQSAAHGTEQVSTNISGVTRAAADTGGAAMSVLQSAGRLTQEADAIKESVDGFLGQIRAA
jgi:methyl-accepting chemotaxis protein